MKVLTTSQMYQVEQDCAKIGLPTDVLMENAGKAVAEEVKRILGAIDQQHLLPYGTAEEIEADVAEKIRVLGEGGGYMCSPAHIIQADTSMENVETFIAAVKKHGVYG